MSLFKLTLSGTGRTYCIVNDKHFKDLIFRFITVYELFDPTYFILHAIWCTSNCFSCIVQTYSVLLSCQSKVILLLSISVMRIFGLKSIRLTSLWLKVAICHQSLIDSLNIKLFFKVGPDFVWIVHTHTGIVVMQHTFLQMVSYYSLVLNWLS